PSFPTRRSSDLAGSPQLRIGEREIPGWLLQHDLADVGGIDRHPAVARRVELRAAVLSLADVTALAETLELLRVGRAHAVDIASGNAGRSRQAHEERVQVGALAAGVARLGHRLDVPQAAAANLRITERVVHDPLVDGPSLLDVAGGALGDLL